MEQNEKQTAIKKNKRTLVIILLVFGGPILAAYITLNYFSGSLKLVNYGKVIRKNVPITADGLLQGISNAKVVKNIFLTKWTYVYIDNSYCDKMCIKNIDNLRRIELAQGKEALKVNRIFVLTDINDSEKLNKKLSLFKNLLVYKLSKEDRDKFMHQFKIINGPEVKKAKRVYLVDPKGRLRMYYESDTREDQNIELLKGMGKDLKTLLKNSLIG